MFLFHLRSKFIYKITTKYTSDPQHPSKAVVVTMSLLLGWAGTCDQLSHVSRHDVHLPLLVGHQYVGGEGEARPGQSSFPV